MNEINDVRTRIEVKTGGGRFTLFETGLCQVPFLDDLQAAGLSSESRENLDRYLSSYDPRDVQIICCEEDAESEWSVPPPTIRSLLASIGDDFTFQTLWEFHRSRPKGNELAVFLPERPFEMNVTLVAQQFRQVLNGTRSSVDIPSMYPRYFRVPASGDVRTLDNTVMLLVSAGHFCFLSFHSSVGATYPLLMVFQQVRFLQMGNMNNSLWS